MIHKIVGNKYNKRICKWIASFLAVTLLVNQNCFSVLAEKYEKYEYIEDVTDTVADEEVENSDVSNEVGTDADVNTNIESDIDSNEESDVNTNESEIISPQHNEEGSIIEEEIIDFDGDSNIPSLYTSTSGYGFYDNDVFYQIITLEDGFSQQVAVSGLSKDAESTVLDIPSTVTHNGQEYTVTCVLDSAFYGCEAITDVILPDTVTSIERVAFYKCCNLKSIIIPDSVTSIGGAAFGDCTSLESITIPNGITCIEYHTFNGCSNLKSVTIPDSVTSIGARAFTYCYSLKNITIPDSVTNIEENAFGSCQSLESITIPTGVTSISSRVFGECYSLKSITFSDNVTNIGYWAFGNCTSLQNITIPNNITNIEQWAFLQCYDLTSVTILNDNIIISDKAFENCDKLSNLQIAISNINVTPIIGENCFTYYPDDRYLTFLTEDGATELSDSTTPTLAEAIAAYNAVDDGGIDDGYWYSWKLPEIGEVPDNEETFTITASAGTGGSITPSGEVKVKSGDSQQFTITPEDGYRVSSILADGNEVLNSEQVTYYSETESSDAGNTDARSSTEYYVFENVTGNHTLAAYFEVINADDNKDPDVPSGDDNKNPDDPSGDDNKNPDVPNGDDTDDNNVPGDSGDNTTPGGSDDNDTSIPTVISDTNVMNNTDIISSNTTAPASKDSEPKTGDASHIETYATIAMIAGLSYLLLYFADGKNGMTEEEKKEIVSALVKWAKKGKRLRKYAALAVIFLVLVYYHSIGKRTSEEWKAVYEK